jgi:uncharacterized membrane protein YhaH (DUF805 family)
MPLIAAVKLGFLNYVNPRGRARRADFWYWFLFVLVVEIILSNIDNNLSNVFSAVTFLPYIMYGIRRMHDTDHRGWWVLCPIVNLVFWATPGNTGENKYGPPPPPTSL